MPDTLERPTLNLMKFTKRERLEITKALTVKIALRKVHFTALMFEITDAYNEHNAVDIKEGKRVKMIADSPMCRSLAPQRLRHQFTNYDELCDDISRSPKSNHLHQIIYTRTMRILKEAYPELSLIIEREIDRKYPMATRFPVCMPTSYEEVVRETNRIHQEEMTPKQLRAAVADHILNTQTYLNDQRKVVLPTMAPHKRNDKAEELRLNTLEVVYLAYPELNQVSKPVEPTPVIEPSAIAVAAVVNRKPASRKFDAESSHALITHLAASMNVGTGSSVMSVIDNMTPSLHPVKLTNELTAEFSLTPISLDELLRKTVIDYNHAGTAKERQLDMKNPDMKDEIYLRAVAMLVGSHSNYPYMMRVVRDLPNTSRTKARRVLEAAIEVIIAEKYPELKEAAKKEKERRIAGRTFQKAYGNLMNALPDGKSPDLQVYTIAELKALKANIDRELTRRESSLP